MKQIDIDDKAIFDKYRIPSILNSEYQFTTLFAWADKYKFSYHIHNGVMYIFGNQNSGALQCYYPLGSNSIEKSLAHIQSVFEEKDAPLNLRPLSKEMLDQMLPHINLKVSIGSKVSYTDYICDCQALLNYSGPQYKRKRKAVNGFYKKYEYAYESLNESNIKAATEGLYEMVSNEEQMDMDEWQAYSRIMNNFGRLSLRGGMLIVDKKVVAISVAESFYDTIIIHIRRCNKAFSGIYPAMLQLLLKNEFSDRDYKYVNLQDDMGIENLRRTKLSYKPIILLKKYYIIEER